MSNIPTGGSLAVASEPVHPFQGGIQSFDGYDPDRLLYPEETGNGDRRFNSRNYHEITQDLTQILTGQYNLRTWVTNMTALFKLWPKIKLPEGVHVIKGSVFNYDVMPQNEVPQRGTIRFMSKTTTEYQLAISQKGIGSRIHGSILDDPVRGPRVIMQELDAYAESTALGMSWNTAMNAVNAAFQHSLHQAGTTFKRNYALKMANELNIYGSSGAHPGRLETVIREELSDNPRFDMVFVDDSSEHLFSGGSPGAILRVPMFSYSDGRFLELESNEVISPIATMRGGAVSVVEMPAFSIHQRHHRMQALESDVTIGEYYADDQTEQYGVASGTPFSPKHNNVVLYDQEANTWRVVRFNQVLEYGHVWDPSGVGYHPDMISFVGGLNKKGVSPTNNRNTPLQYPVAHAKGRAGTNGEYYLPEFIGNLSEEHLSDHLLLEMIETGVDALTLGTQNRTLFADAKADISVVDRIRRAIEGLGYDAAAFESIAAANIERSVVQNDDGKFIFRGERTPADRIIPESDMVPILEWAPNDYGGLDVPAGTKAVGMFSAAGIQTLAYTPGHPLQQEAAQAYEFLEMLSKRMYEIFGLGAVMDPKSTSPHLHNDDPVQCVLDAVFGRRIPLFLAAPAALISGPVTLGSLSNTVSVTIGGEVLSVISTGNPEDGIMLEERDGSIRVLESPSGVAIAITGGPEAVQPNSAFFVDSFIAEFLAPDRGTALSSNNDVSAENRAALISFRRQFVAKLLSLKTNRIQWIRMSRGLVLSKGKSTNFVAATKAWFGTKRTTAEKTEYLDKTDLSKDDAQALMTALDTYVETNGRTYSRLPDADRAIVDANSAAYGELTNLFAAVIERAGVPGVSYFYSEDTTLIVGGSNTRVNIYSLMEDDEKDTVVTLLSAIGGSSSFGVFIVSGGLRRGSGDANVHDVFTARFYRSPLNATLKMLRQAASFKAPWIHPADPSESFNTFVKLSSNDDLPAIFTSEDHENWLLNTQVNFKPVLPSSSGANNDFFLDWLRVAYQGSRSETIIQGATRGSMQRRLMIVRASFHMNMVKRLIGVVILLQTHTSLHEMRSMAERGVMQPFSLCLWRLNSKGRFSDVLLAKSGPESGVNLWNNAKVMTAWDGTRNDVQIRVTINTDAHVIRPENHRLLGPIKPRGYIGGHNVRVIKSPAVLGNGMREEHRPAVIVTVVPRGHMETRADPVSFINNVPALVDRKSLTPLEADLNRQYWSGGDFYGKHVYGMWFSRENTLRFDGIPRLEMTRFKAASHKHNHLAWRGYQGRFNVVTRMYDREVVGTGHRADPRMNSPGARAYFNGQDPILVAHKTLQDARIS